MKLKLINTKVYAIIDDEDYDKIKHLRWRLSTIGYVTARDNVLKQEVYIHRLLLNAPNNLLVDHINKNKLDNRKINIRLVTKSQNAMNSKKQNNNTSGCRGVYWRQERSCWLVYINVNGKRIGLGHYKDFNSAVATRKEGELKYFGEYKSSLED